MYNIQGTLGAKTLVDMRDLRFVVFSLIEGLPPSTSHP